MSEMGNLNEAREARRMGELLSQLDEALKAEGIEPDTTLGACFAMLRASFERQEVSQREFRAFLVTFGADLDERLLRLVEEGRAVAESYQATAKDELAKVDRMARKAEADLRRKQLAVEDSILETLERVTPQIVSGVKEASVIRAKAFNRVLYARELMTGMAVVLVVLGLTFEAGRLSRAPRLPVQAISQSDSQ